MSKRLDFDGNSSREESVWSELLDDKGLTCKERQKRARLLANKLSTFNNRLSESEVIEEEETKEDSSKVPLFPIKPSGSAETDETAQNKRPDITKILENYEEELLGEVQAAMSAPLTSVYDRAQGIVYSQRMKPIAGWTVPKKYSRLSEDETEMLRDKLRIDVEGVECPPPIPSFRDMCLPQGIVQGLALKKIKIPTQIQMQGLPAALLGRDLIGIAFTGSGKTVVFVLPMLLRALERELLLPVGRMQGPIAVCVVPSRELAYQIQETVEYYAHHLATVDGFPLVKSVLCVGGTSVAEQTQRLAEGAHIAVATPGRLNDMLDRKKLSLRQCIFLCMDEADRMVDLGFEEEVRNTLAHFKQQKQTLLFSATMPKKIQHFATSALVDPLIVNVGRAGAANLDVVQEVEYVRQEDRLRQLTESIQKTGPPCIVFAENKGDVDLILEYLLLKNLEAVAIHGGLDMQERREAVQLFKEGQKDILVGTDVASKGLDFPAIKHVINFDMPREIENYVHRIGRTGRCGKTGLATTYVNGRVDDTVLLDLRALLLEAKQVVPEFLDLVEQRLTSGEGLESGVAVSHEEIGGVRGCAYCGGLGHRIGNCPKLEKNKRDADLSKKDHLVQGSRYGNTAGYGGDW